jgi:NAD+ synthase (glutamine-hydrolysing)
VDFANLYAQGFARVAARVVPITLANPAANAAAIIADLEPLSADGCVVAAYPELCLTGYSCDDLFGQDTLLDAAEDAIAELLRASKGLLPIIVVGAPLRHQNRLYNCAVVMQGGRLLGVVPKSYLPNYREFYERRWFAPGDDVNEHWESRRHDWLSAKMASRHLLSAAAFPGLTLGVEVCEDMWVPQPPSVDMALGGATVIVNISGSPITIGKADDRKLLARSASARCNCAYVFTAAGPGESSTDLSWDGQTFVYECGELLGESQRFPSGPSGTVVDVDLRRLEQERYRQGTQDDNLRTQHDRLASGRPIAPPPWARARRAGVIAMPGMFIGFDPDNPDESHFTPPDGDFGLRRPVDRFPFVPDDPARLAQDCFEAYSIQVYGLAQRVKSIGAPKLVIGVSGGLDSTHALIVCAKALDLLGRPRSDILAFTMPGFATSDATKSNALALMDAVGATAETLDIRPAASQMLRDLGHPFADGRPVFDVTFENVQAGLRTDYLFRAANQRGGIVVGTGDLSELALGWCTYGVGDQMSHYGVNVGVPKTLIQHLIRWVVSQNLFDAAANAALERILGQEISPELVPAGEGQAMQSTESTIGPYALNDFFLYHLLRRGATPSRIAFLAWTAWHDAAAGQWPEGWADDRRVAYDLPTIKAWLVKFYRRFFANQFKRSAIPNGPKVVAGGSLSPRGDWRMPSDASPTAWIAEAEQVPDAI